MKFSLYKKPMDWELSTNEPLQFKMLQKMPYPISGILVIVLIPPKSSSQKHTLNPELIPLSLK